MKDLYALKEMLVSELSDYGRSGKLSSSSLDAIDKLAHATKNVIKVIECCEKEGYSREAHRDVTKDYVRPDGSYRRDAMGRYSRDEGMDEHTKEKLREMINSL